MCQVYITFAAITKKIKISMTHNTILKTLFLSNYSLIEINVYINIISIHNDFLIEIKKFTQNLKSIRRNDLVLLRTQFSNLDKTNTKWHMP